MKIAVASGKGGTGKTTVAANLARVLDAPVQLLDCDVEEPNLHLFISGVLLCYFWVLQISLKGMAAYNRWLNVPADIWRAEEYFGFVTFFMIGMGVCFELPIVVLALVKVGIVDYKTLRKSRPYFFIALFGVVAFITPDFISTFFLVLPVLFLLEICIWIAYYWDKQQAAREAAEAKAEDRPIEDKPQAPAVKSEPEVAADEAGPEEGNRDDSDDDNDKK